MPPGVRRCGPCQLCKGSNGSQPALLAVQCQGLQEPELHESPHTAPAGHPVLVKLRQGVSALALSGVLP